MSPTPEPSLRESVRDFAMQNWGDFIAAVTDTDPHPLFVFVDRQLVTRHMKRRTPPHKVVAELIGVAIAETHQELIKSSIRHDSTRFIMPQANGWFDGRLREYMRSITPTLNECSVKLVFATEPIPSLRLQMVIPDDVTGDLFQTLGRMNLKGYHVEGQQWLIDVL